MTIVILSGILAIALAALSYLFYRFIQLKESIKNFNPVVHNVTNVIKCIGDVRNFSEEDDMNLSINKDILKQLLKKIQFRMSEYTKILHSSYRITGYNGDQAIYALKSDSEKWLEQGKMSGYDDIESDIRHLIAMEK